MFQKKREKVKTHILCSVTFFFENLAVYEIMWKNIVQPDRSQMTIWRMHIACWIPKATETHSQYVILIVFHGNNGYANEPQFTLYVHCLCCWSLELRIPIYRPEKNNHFTLGECLLHKFESSERYAVCCSLQSFKSSVYSWQYKEHFVEWCFGWGDTQYWPPRSPNFTSLLSLTRVVLVLEVVGTNHPQRRGRICGRVGLTLTNNVEVSQRLFPRVFPLRV
jgi:hypothetical protein